MKVDDKIKIILKGHLENWPPEFEKEFKEKTAIEVTIVVMIGDKVAEIKFDKLDFDWSVEGFEYEIIDDKKLKKKLGRDPIAEVGAEIKALDDLKIAMGIDSYIVGLEIINEAIKRIKEMTRFNEDSVGVISEKEQKIDYLVKEIASLKGEIATKELTKPLQLDFAGNKVTIVDLLGVKEFKIDTTGYNK